MDDHDYSTLHVGREGGIARVTLDDPPVNVFSATMMLEVRHLLTALREDDAVRVVVFDSAHPDFFIAHVDMTLGGEPGEVERLMADLPDAVNPFQVVGELLRTQPQVTIVELAGTARGGGAEFVAAADMAFAAIGTAGLGQVEALMGIIPGGGGTQHLPGRIGRHRALEVLLGADLFDAETAERYGWVNRALPAQELHGFVDRLARNIAALPEGVAAAVKGAVPPEDRALGLVREHEAWAGLVGRPAAQRLIAAGLARGAQTPDGERDLEGLLRAAGA